MIITTTIKELLISFSDGKLHGAAVIPEVTTIWPDGTKRVEVGQQIPLRTFKDEVVNSGLPQDQIGDLAKTLRSLDLQSVSLLDYVQAQHDEVKAELETVKEEHAAVEAEKVQLEASLAAAEDEIKKLTPTE